MVDMPICLKVALVTYFVVPGVVNNGLVVIRMAVALVVVILWVLIL